MKEGFLYYDKSCGRYDIVFNDGSYYGGLHCGDCFEIHMNGDWTPVRIEYSREWYLPGFIDIRLDSLKVRM